jgi:hypothetical protein
MLELLKIKKDINWLIDQVKCLVRKKDLESPLSATEWSPNHSIATGNPYILDCFVWFEGHVYKSLINDNNYPPTNDCYWADLGIGHLLLEEQSNWDATTGRPFIRNKPTKTSDFINDGEDGTSPFATLEDITVPVIPNLQEVTDEGANTTNGISIDTEDTYQIGLYAISSDIGIKGESREGYGVYGFSPSSAGVYGTGSYGVHGSSSYTGVYGDGGTYGVYGRSSTGIAVYGYSDYGIGLFGTSDESAGVSAYSSSNVGLEIYGNGTIAIEANLGNSNKGLVINSGASSTGNFIELDKNGVDKLVVNQAGELTAEKLIKNGGASSQFLKADGSTDSTAYYPYPIGTISQYLRGDGTLATFPSLTSGTVTSVGLSMPSAFTVTNSPVTSSDTLTVIGAGLASQYIRGDGQLASFPEIAGGGGGQVYYCNGGTSQGTIGTDSFYQLSTGANLGTSANFTSGTVDDIAFANFITDIGKPTQEVVPAGVWLFQCYLSASASNVLEVYATIEVYNGSTFYVLATSLVEVITNGTTEDLYTFTCAVPEYAPLTTSDRIAIRFYPKNLTAGNTITLYTQSSNLSTIQSTFTTGLAALNGLTSAAQLLATGTTGNDFAINSTDITHTFNIPNASSATNRRGLLTASDWTTFNNKLTPNTAITAATKTKITYDSKGLVTVGADATTADIADSTNRRYVTDAKLAVLNNTTNNNSGDNAINTLYSGLATSKQNVLSGTGFVKSTAGTISYDTNTYTIANAAITAGTSTKITYDVKGLVTAGASLIASDIPNIAQSQVTNLVSALAGKQPTINLTVAGTSGAATLVGNTLNIPQYAGGTGGGGTVTSVAKLTLTSIADTDLSSTVTGSTGNVVITLNVPNASNLNRGVVTILPQTFAGIKSFTEDLVVNALTVGKGGAIGNTAVNNTAIGVNALKVNTANNNTAIGKSALANNVAGYQNTAIGVEALLNNVGGPSSVNPTIPYVGIYNTAVGFESLKSNTGNNNTAVGIGTLTSNTIGFQNTAVGSEALKANTSGEENTAVGKDALKQNTDSNWNTALGSSALQGNIGGFQNTAVGRYASYSNSGGAYNTSIGVDSLAANISSNLNTGLGYKAGYTVTGARNTFLGSQDDSITSSQVTTVSNSIAIGYNAYTTKNNQVVLGNSIISETVLNGVIKQSGTTFTVSNVGNVTALGFFNSSDARLKDIIEQDGDTIKFTWKDKRDDKVHIGYVAQEIQEKYPDQVSEGEDKMLSVNYIEVLVAKIQELENRIKQLEK